MVGTQRVRERQADGEKLADMHRAQSCVHLVRFSPRLNQLLGVFATCSFMKIQTIKFRRKGLVSGHGFFL